MPLKYKAMYIWRVGYRRKGIHFTLHKVDRGGLLWKFYLSNQIYIF